MGKYPGWRTMTRAQRINAKHDAIWEEARRLKAIPRPCRVFLLCENDATTTIPHPILGDVPACDRCKAKMDRLERRN